LGARLRDRWQHPLRTANNTAARNQRRLGQWASWGSSCTRNLASVLALLRPSDSPIPVAPRSTVVLPDGFPRSAGRAPVSPSLTEPHGATARVAMCRCHADTRAAMSSLASRPDNLRRVHKHSVSCLRDRPLLRFSQLGPIRCQQLLCPLGNRLSVGTDERTLRSLTHSLTHARTHARTHDLRRQSRLGRACTRTRGWRRTGKLCRMRVPHSARTRRNDTLAFTRPERAREHQELARAEPRRGGQRPEKHRRSAIKLRPCPERERRVQPRVRPRRQ
jgi:hypothetical protein